jgi:3-methyladenine DNA glycosylase AlkC
MADTIPFKDYYGLELAQLLADKLRPVYPAFDADAFLEAMRRDLDRLELKGRVRLIAAGLRAHLPPDYPQALAVLLQILGPALDGEDGMFERGYWVYPIAQFVEEYGLEHFDVSAPALVEITKRFSSEFAVRPYLIQHEARMMALLRSCVDNPNPHVRRWVSEGTRPRLPWGIRLEAFIRDPEPTLALLEHLKDDPSAYVRKSVANHLNDLTKDHPARVLEVARRWYADGAEGTRWIVRHALRTLIKAGNLEALALLGYGTGDGLRATLRVQPTRIAPGEALMMEAIIEHPHAEAQPAVIDYRILFVRANGSSSAKVFKWTTCALAAGAALRLEKRHPMREVTTRRLYPGLHRVELQVNGIILAEASFELEAPHR